MDDTINYLANHGVMAASANSTHVGAKYGMLWIDVEGTQVRRNSPTESNISTLFTLLVSLLCSTGLPTTRAMLTSSRPWLTMARAAVSASVSCLVRLLSPSEDGTYISLPVGRHLHQQQPVVSHHRRLYGSEQLPAVVPPLRQQPVLLRLGALRRLVQALHQAVRWHHLLLRCFCGQELLLNARLCLPVL